MVTRSRTARRLTSGQAAVEAVIALLLLCLVFFALVQIAYLYIGQMVAHHTAFVMARSYVTGFEERIVHRAREVGSIGMAGHLVQPVAYTTLSPAQLGALDEELIREFLDSPTYTMRYEYWDRIDGTVPLTDGPGIQDFRVRVWNYPLELPMRGAYMDSGSVDFGSDARLYNHAAYYLW